MIIQGREITTNDVSYIRQLISDHPDWHRTRLSRELCKHWSWIAGNGCLKDMAARGLLRKLDALGLIPLPEPLCSANNEFRHRSALPLGVDCTPIQTMLRDLRPVQVAPVVSEAGSRLFRALLARYHYLGYNGPVGENLKYLVFDKKKRPLGCLLFGAAAWKVACRDKFIGWPVCVRGLSLIVNNMRFLLLPWVRVPHLASHVLGLAVRRICGDWEFKYGHSIVLLETFVDNRRFAGTCYRAANWVKVGETKGRSRNDRTRKLRVPVKSVYLYPLRDNFRSILLQTME